MPRIIYEPKKAMKTSWLTRLRVPFRVMKNPVQISMSLILRDDVMLSEFMIQQRHALRCLSNSTDNCNDAEEGPVRCNFTIENEISCDSGTSQAQQEMDVKRWLDEIPKAAYSFAKACYQASDDRGARFVRVVSR